MGDAPKEKGGPKLLPSPSKERIEGRSRREKEPGGSASDSDDSDDDSDTSSSSLSPSSSEGDKRSSGGKRKQKEDASLFRERGERRPQDAAKGRRHGQRSSYRSSKRSSKRRRNSSDSSSGSSSESDTADESASSSEDDGNSSERKHKKRRMEDDNDKEKVKRSGKSKAKEKRRREKEKELEKKGKKGKKSKRSKKGKEKKDKEKKDKDKGKKRRRREGSERGDRKHKGGQGPEDDDLVFLPEEDYGELSKLKSMEKNPFHSKMKAEESQREAALALVQRARERLNSGEIQQAKAEQAQMQRMYGTVDWRAEKKLRREKRKLERTVHAGNKLASLEAREAARMDAFRAAMGLPTSEAQRQAEWRAAATEAMAALDNPGLQDQTSKRPKGPSL